MERASVRAPRGGLRSEVELLLEQLVSRVAPSIQPRSENSLLAVRFLYASSVTSPSVLEPEPESVKLQLAGIAEKLDVHGHHSHAASLRRTVNDLVCSGLPNSWRYLSAMVGLSEGLLTGSDKIMEHVVAARDIEARTAFQGAALSVGGEISPGSQDSDMEDWLGEFNEDADSDSDGDVGDEASAGPVVAPTPHRSAGLRNATQKMALSADTAMPVNPLKLRPQAAAGPAGITASAEDTCLHAGDATATVNSGARADPVLFERFLCRGLCLALLGETDAACCCGTAAHMPSACARRYAMGGSLLCVPQLIIADSASGIGSPVFELVSAAILSSRPAPSSPPIAVATMHDDSNAAHAASALDAGAQMLSKLSPRSGEFRLSPACQALAATGRHYLNDADVRPPLFALQLAGCSDVLRVANMLRATVFLCRCILAHDAASVTATAGHHSGALCSCGSLSSCSAAQLRAAAASGDGAAALATALQAAYSSITSAAGSVSAVSPLSGTVAGVPQLPLFGSVARELAAELLERCANVQAAAAELLRSAYDEAIATGAGSRSGASGSHDSGASEDSDTSQQPSSPWQLLALGCFDDDSDHTSEATRVEGAGAAQRVGAGGKMGASPSSADTWAPRRPHQPLHLTVTRLAAWVAALEPLVQQLHRIALDVFITGTARRAAAAAAAASTAAGVSVGVAAADSIAVASSAAGLLVPGGSSPRSLAPADALAASPAAAQAAAALAVAALQLQHVPAAAAAEALDAVGSLHQALAACSSQEFRPEPETERAHAHGTHASADLRDVASESVAPPLDDEFSTSKRRNILATDPLQGFPQPPALSVVIAALWRRCTAAYLLQVEQFALGDGERPAVVPGFSSSIALAGVAAGAADRAGAPAYLSPHSAATPSELSIIAPAAVSRAAGIWVTWLADLWVQRVTAIAASLGDAGRLAPVPATNIFVPSAIPASALLAAAADDSSTVTDDSHATVVASASGLAASTGRHSCVDGAPVETRVNVCQTFDVPPLSAPLSLSESALHGRAAGSRSVTAGRDMVPGFGAGSALTVIDAATPYAFAAPPRRRRGAGGPPPTRSAAADAAGVLQCALQLRRTRALLRSASLHISGAAVLPTSRHALIGLAVRGPAKSAGAVILARAVLAAAAAEAASAAGAGAGAAPSSLAILSQLPPSILLLLRILQSPGVGLSSAAAARACGLSPIPLTFQERAALRASVLQGFSQVSTGHAAADSRAAIVSSTPQPGNSEAFSSGSALLQLLALFGNAEPAPAVPRPVHSRFGGPAAALAAVHYLLAGPAWHLPKSWRAGAGAGEAGQGAARSQQRKHTSAEKRLRGPLLQQPQLLSRDFATPRRRSPPKRAVGHDDTVPSLLGEVRRPPAAALAIQSGDHSAQSSLASFAVSLRRMSIESGLGDQSQATAGMGNDSVADGAGTVKPVIGRGYLPMPGLKRSAWWDINAQVDVKKQKEALEKQQALELQEVAAAATGDRLGPFGTSSVNRAAARRSRRAAGGGRRRRNRRLPLVPSLEVIAEADEEDEEEEDDEEEEEDAGATEEDEDEQDGHREELDTDVGNAAIDGQNSPDDGRGVAAPASEPAAALSVHDAQNEAACGGASEQQSAGADVGASLDAAGSLLAAHVPSPVKAAATSAHFSPAAAAADHVGREESKPEARLAAVPRIDMSVLPGITTDAGITADARAADASLTPGQPRRDAAAALSPAARADAAVAQRAGAHAERGSFQPASAAAALPSQASQLGVAPWALTAAGAWQLLGLGQASEWQRMAIASGVASSSAFSGSTSLSLGDMDTRGSSAWPVPRITDASGPEKLPVAARRASSSGDTREHSFNFARLRRAVVAWLLRSERSASRALQLSLLVDGRFLDHLWALRAVALLEQGHAVSGFLRRIFDAAAAADAPGGASSSAAGFGIAPAAVGGRLVIAGSRGAAALLGLGHGLGLDSQGGSLWETGGSQLRQGRAAAAASGRGWRSDRAAAWSLSTGASGRSSDRPTLAMDDVLHLRNSAALTAWLRSSLELPGPHLAQAAVSGTGTADGSPQAHRKAPSREVTRWDSLAARVAAAAAETSGSGTDAGTRFGVAAGLGPDVGIGGSGSISSLGSIDFVGVMDPSAFSLEYTAAAPAGAGSTSRSSMPSSGEGGKGAAGASDRGTHGSSGASQLLRHGLRLRYSIPPPLSACGVLTQRHLEAYSEIFGVLLRLRWALDDGEAAATEMRRADAAIGAAVSALLTGRRLFVPGSGSAGSAASSTASGKGKGNGTGAAASNAGNGSTSGAYAGGAGMGVLPASLAQALAGTHALQCWRRCALQFLSAVSGHTAHALLGTPWKTFLAALASPAGCDSVHAVAAAHEAYLASLTRVCFLAPDQARAAAALDGLVTAACELAAGCRAYYATLLAAVRATASAHAAVSAADAFLAAASATGAASGRAAAAAGAAAAAAETTTTRHIARPTPSVDDDHHDGNHRDRDSDAASVASGASGRFSASGRSFLSSLSSVTAKVDMRPPPGALRRRASAAAAAAAAAGTGPAAKGSSASSPQPDATVVEAADAACASLPRQLARMRALFAAFRDRLAVLVRAAHAHSSVRAGGGQGGTGFAGGSGSVGAAGAAGGDGIGSGSGGGVSLLDVALWLDFNGFYSRAGGGIRNTTSGTRGVAAAPDVTEVSDAAVPHHISGGELNRTSE